MTTGGQRAASALADWMAQRTGPPQAMALIANKMEDVVAADRSVLRVDQLARRLDLSIRSLQRLCEKYISLPPPTRSDQTATGSRKRHSGSGRIRPSPLRKWPPSSTTRTMRT